MNSITCANNERFFKIKVQMKNTKQVQSKRYKLKWIPVHLKIPSNTLSDNYGLLFQMYSSVPSCVVVFITTGMLNINFGIKGIL